MTDISNDRYITVKRDEKGEIVVLVGDKPATTYHGEKIWYIEVVKEIFALMQEQNPEIEEFHIGAFATRGKYAEVGNPSGEFGPNAWCRVKKKGSSRAPWVFYDAYGSAANCANNCAYNCAANVRDDALFRSAVLGSAIDKQNVNPMAKSKNPEIEKLKTVDFSKLPKSPIELNGYEIVVRKLKTHTK